MKETEKPEIRDRESEVRNQDKNLSAATTNKTHDKQPKICLIKGCNKKVAGRGLCSAHYTAWQEGRIMHPDEGEYVQIRPQKRYIKNQPSTPLPEGEKCLIDDCNKPAKTRGLCHADYQAWRKGMVSHPVLGRFMVAQNHFKSKIIKVSVEKTPEIINNSGEKHMSKDSKASYYDAGGIETLDIIKAKLTPEQYQGYLLGCSLKYQCRLMHKADNNEERIRDAEKAANYSRWLVEELRD